MINRKKVDSLIPKAIEAITNAFGVEIGGKVRNEYRGYISSFGTAVRMSGIKTAVCIYSKKTESDEDKSKIVRMIYYMLNDSGDNENIDENKAKEYLLEKIKEDEIKAKNEILEAAVAIKLALNLFELEKD